MKTRTSSEVERRLHETAQVGPILEHAEHAAEVLRPRELGLLHHVQEALAEDLLDRGGVEVMDEA